MAYMWNLKYTNELIYKTETDSQQTHSYQRGKAGGGGLGW